MKKIYYLYNIKKIEENLKFYRESILNVIRDSVPVEKILRSYIDETVDEEIIEEIIEKNMTDKEAEKIENEINEKKMEKKKKKKKKKKRMKKLKLIK